MTYTNRIAVSAVALVATLSPACAIASTPGASPGRHHSPTTHSAAKHQAAATKKGRAAGVQPVAAPAPAPASGAGTDPVVAKYDQDTDTLLRQDTDAQFEAGIPAWVACMNTAGLPTVATPTGITAGGWTFGTPTDVQGRFLDSPAGEDASMQIQDTCLVQTYHLQ